MESNDKEIKVVSHHSAPRYETSGAACFDIAIDFEEGQRVAQGMIAKAEQVCIRLVSELSETRRSDGGFGSTGE